MFGLIKENIINNLEKVYLGEDKKDFKIKFNNFLSVIKESKDLKTFYSTYKELNEVSFEDEATSRDFVNEVINILSVLDKKCVNVLNTLCETKEPLMETSKEFYLDNIIFNSKLSIKDKAEYKSKLIKSLMKESENIGNLLDSAETNLNDKMSNLSEDQINLINLFVENNQPNIDAYYKNLINETQSLLDDKIIESTNNDTTVKLIEAKKKLKNIVNESTLHNIESLMELKSSF